MAHKELLLGDEAVALGALHAGLSGVYAYPGTPSTEIAEYIQGHPLAKERDVFRRWCCNEKTAMEGALGVSYAGKRAIVCMKHVGMNVCADPFMGSAMTGANGGLVVTACDDPSMHSSQNEQDSRFYAKFAMIPAFEPSNQQEAYDMTREAFDYSESRGIPVLMRLTTRMAHSRAVVTPGEARPENEMHLPKNPRKWVTLPVNARVHNRQLIKDYATFEEDAVSSRFNSLTDGPDRSMGVIACGITYNYLMENFPDGCPYPVLKISQYPFPRKLALRLAEMTGTILVLEEGQPVVEEMLRGVFPIGTKILGRIDEALRLAPLPTFQPSEVVVPRPPALCQGCGHRDFFTAINMALEKYPGGKVFSDIGCYTLGYMAPLNAVDTCVEMGASFTMAQGAAHCGLWPSIAVLGDSTFTHSGMTGLLDAINSNADVVLCISDNLTTAMTGGQDSAGTGRIEAICAGLGVDKEHIRTIIPLPKNYEEMVKVIREEIEYHGVSVIVSRRECLQTLKRHAKK